VPVSALLVSTVGIGLAALLNAVYHDRSFLLMLAIAMFGPMFTWMMIFVTHLNFRRRNPGAQLAFRMWGYPWTSLAGAGLMLAALLTTLFTPAFRPTLIYGVPFLCLLSIAYAIHRRRRVAAPHPTLQETA
jgi:L-asparagine transporter-like permease